MSAAGSGWRWTRSPWLLLLVLAWVAGAWLRLHQLPAQILADDELHALRYLRHHGAWEIFTHFGAADHCIPLTLYDLAVARAVGLSEAWVRAPVLLAGLAALVVLPLQLRPLLGARTAALFAWLLAISPLQVYFSRYARPYAPVFLLASAGLLAFHAWWRGGSRRQAWIFGVCAVLTPWFHPVAGPFVAAPLLLAAALRLTGRAGPGAPGWRPLLALGAAVAAGWAALLLPPLLSDLAALRGRAGLSQMGAGALPEVFELMSGAQRPILAFLVGLSILSGLVVLKREQPLLLGLLAGGSAILLAAIAWSGPEVVEVPIVLARYAIPVQLLVLLAAACGLGRLDQRFAEEVKLAPPWAVSLPVAAALLLLGPLLPVADPRNAVYYRPNGWTNHALFQYQYGDRERRSYLAKAVWSGRGTAFWGRLRAMGEAGEDLGPAIVQAPWIPEWHHSPFVIHQRFHRRPVWVGLVGDGETPIWELPWPDERFRFRNLVHVGDHRRLEAEGVRFVVFHKRLASEMPIPPPMEVPDPADWIERYRVRYGEAFFEDELVCVFELSP